MDGFSPRPWSFFVTDHFTSGMYQYDDNYAFIHIEDAQRMLELGDAITDIHIHVADIYQAPEIRDRLAEELGYPYQVRDWTQLFPEFFRLDRVGKMGDLPRAESHRAGRCFLTSCRS